MAYYRICPYCKGNIDPGEKCDCIKERAREFAHAVGFPFLEKPYDEEFDPYVFDGGMSVEDFRLMHRMMGNGNR